MAGQFLCRTKELRARLERSVGRGRGMFPEPSQGNGFVIYRPLSPTNAEWPLGSRSASLLFTPSVGRSLAWPRRPGVPAQPQARGRDVPVPHWRLALSAYPPVPGLVNTSQGSPPPRESSSWHCGCNILPAGLCRSLRGFVGANLAHKPRASTLKDRDEGRKAKPQLGMKGAGAPRWVQGMRLSSAGPLPAW